MKEIWKELDANYLVSSTGKVWSRFSKKELSQFKDSDGYLQVTLYGKTAKVHRLIAKVFIPNEDCDSLTVNHRDGIKTNNSADNLEWLSVLDNIKHAKDSGLVARGVDCRTTILTDEIVAEIKQLFVEHKLTDTEIGHRYNANNSTISNIRRNIAWRHVRPDLVYSPKSPSDNAPKLCREDVLVIREMAKLGDSINHIARSYQVNPTTIRSILSGKTWSKV